MAITKVTRNLLSTGIDDQSNATAITITSAENVGIGITSTDSHRLKIYGAGNGGRQLQIEGTSNNGLARFSNTESQDYSIGINDTSFIVYDDTADAYRMVVDSSGNVGIGLSSPSSYANDNNSLAVLGQVRIQGVTNSASVPILALRDTNSGLFVPAANSIGFSTGSAERMRIDSSGNVIFGTSPVSSPYEGAVIENLSNGARLNIGRSANAIVMGFYNTNGNVGSISTSGSSTSYNTSSDYRLKENIITDWDATTRLKQLRPSRFNFIADADTTVDGFLAHEVEDIVPEAITGTKDAMREEEYEVTPAVLDDDGNVVTEAVMGTREVPEYQGIDQSKLVPLLTKALQEQQTMIEDLKARIETLENA